MTDAFCVSSSARAASRRFAFASISSFVRKRVRRWSDGPLTLDGTDSDEVLGPAISETLGVTLDGTDTEHVPRAAISETLGAFAAPATLDVSDSRLATAYSTVPPLQASTQSAPAAESRNFDARTSRIARLRAPDLRTVFGFIAGIARNNKDEGHRSSAKRKKEAKMIEKIAQGEERLVSRRLSRRTVQRTTTRRARWTRHRRERPPPLLRSSQWRARFLPRDMNALL